MYIILSQTADRDGFQGQVALNITRINGFGEVSFKDVGGNSQKDKEGYVGTYTEVLMKGATVLVADTISDILTRIANKIADKTIEKNKRSQDKPTTQVIISEKLPMFTDVIK